MSLVKIIWREAEQWRRDLDKAEKKMVRNARTALRISGYRLMRKMKDELRHGQAGGQKFAPLSMIRGFDHETRKAKSPLLRFARMARYWEDAAGKQYLVSVGFQERPTVSLAGKSSRSLDPSWARLIKRHQEGFSKEITPLARQAARQTGALHKAEGRGRLAKYFFFRKSTTMFKIPARPIIDPFWAANAAGVEAEIQRNFEAKQRGERI